MSNCERTVEEIEGEIGQSVAEFRSSGWRGTEAGINLGVRLIEWERYIPKRQRGRSEKAKWGLSKATSARVRVLANNALLIRQEYNKGTASRLPDPITFMGVYTWTQKETGNFRPRTKSAKARTNGSTSDTNEADGDGADTANEIATLRRELREALNRIKDLEQKLVGTSNDHDPDVDPADSDNSEDDRGWVGEQFTGEMAANHGPVNVIRNLYLVDPDNVRN